MRVGRTLGHYRILEPLGKGGMGEVYRADDKTLKRQVAIKILPEAFTEDPERLARFEREAEVLASLNHPNIAAIYDLAQENGIHFLVMELSAGEDLAARLARGPIAIGDALPLALQIAEAMEAAHERGIVHRDLKPANVMVSRDGTIKVLDFGLAKAWEPEARDSELSQSPTLTARMTQAGVILGTAAYMSPEQARGQEVDKRADIWAFGCLLYEMLTAERAFQGDTVTDSLAKILEREPDWNALPRDTPKSVRTLLRRCLAKDPHRRIHDMGDVRLELEDVLAHPQEESPTGPPSGRGRAPVGFGAGLLALGAAATAALLTWVLIAPAPRPAQPKARLSLSLEQPLNVTEIQLQKSSLLSLAPDGSAVAYLGREGNTSQIYLMPLDGGAPAPVPGTQGTRAPFFSPDGKRLGFVDGTDLKVVPLGGGAPIMLAPSFSQSRASWTTEGGIVFSNNEGIFRKRAEDREPIRIGAPAEGRVLTDPFSLPGGEAVLLASLGPLWGDSSRVEVLSVSTGERRVLVESGGSPSFVPSSAAGSGAYLVYGLGGRLFAAPLDLEGLNLAGPSVAVVDNVRMRSNGDAAQYSFSSTGVLVYASEQGISELVWVDDAGGARILSEEQRAFAMPRLSPDGSYLAVEVHEVPHQIWLLDIEKDMLSRFTFENSNHYFAWYPDSRSILFTSDTGDGVRLLWKRVDSPGEAVTIYAGSLEAWIVSLSQDGRAAAFHAFTADDDFNVFVLPLDGGTPPQATGPPIPVATSPFAERDPWISPDGECVAYVSSETGASEIYVSCWDEGMRRQVSAGGGREPVWSRTGTEIYYRSENRMMVVEVERVPEFRTSTPHALFEGSYRHFDPANFDVGTADRGFVRLRPVGHSDSARHLPIRFDWFDELEAKMREAGS